MSLIYSGEGTNPLSLRWDTAHPRRRAEPEAKAIRLYVLSEARR